LSEKFILSLYLYRGLTHLFFFVVLIIRFWINKFFQYRFHNIVSLYSVVNVQANPNSLESLNSSSFGSFSLLFIISISVLIRLHSRDYFLHHSPAWGAYRPEVSSPNFSILSLQVLLSTTSFTFRYMSVNFFLVSFRFFSMCFSASVLILYFGSFRIEARFRLLLYTPV